MKKLYLSRTDKKIAGVCGGFGEYLEVDSTTLRIIWVLIVILTGIFPGVIVYIVAWLIMPLPLSVAEPATVTDIA